jgi:drug/metabolite transporter (DMT)-like permease
MEKKIMTQEKMNSPRSSLLLVLTALIWGVAFVAQSEGMNHVGGFTFIGCRYILGGAVLLPVICAIRRINRAEYDKLGPDGVKNLTKTGIIGGTCCGICLFVASSLQQFGIAYTTVGKAGFITALYMVIVPIFGIFLHKKIGLNVWISVGLAVVGMYLLCITENFTIGKGDFLVLLCAVAFSFHILTIDHFSPMAEGVVISCTQFFVSGILGCIAMFLFETPTIEAILAAGLPIAYAGIMSSGVAYTLQIVAQKDMDPTIASLIMSLESVFSLLAGWVLLGQKLSAKELLGCVLVFAAILLVQIPVEKLRR